MKQSKGSEEKYLVLRRNRLWYTTRDVDAFTMSRAEQTVSACQAAHRDHDGRLIGARWPAIDAKNLPDQKFVVASIVGLFSL